MRFSRELVPSVVRGKPRIRAVFFFWLNRFNWFSRFRADDKVGCSSNQTSFTGRRLAVQSAPLPALCSSEPVLWILRYADVV